MSAYLLTTRTWTNKFSLCKEVFIFLNYCCWVCKHIQVYLSLPNCSFKICEKPSTFSKSVCVVIFMSAQSTTTPTPLSTLSMTTLTPFPRGEQLRRQCVHVVKDYANIVPAQSMAILAHVCVVNDYEDTNFQKYQIKFAVTCIFSFLLFPK